MEDENSQEVPQPVFEGFRKPEKPEKGFYHVPNEWTNITAKIDNLAELKVIEYIMRHTWGFKEYGEYKVITTDEFMHGRKKSNGKRMDEGTGLSNRSVIDGLRSAIAHGYVLCRMDDSDGARNKKAYALKMKEEKSTCEETSQ